VSTNGNCGRRHFLKAASKLSSIFCGRNIYMVRRPICLLPIEPVLFLALGIIPSLLVACAAPAVTSTPEALLVSAASNMMPALEELGTRYQKETGTPVTFNFAASGQLAQQIDQGAPVDLFVSADVDYVDGLAARGRIVPDSVQIYARGRLTLWTRADSGLTVETLQDLLKPGIQRIAIANPELAPYGKAARQALQAAGLWQQVEPRLVLGENVRQTLQYAETGDVDVALVPLALSITTNGHWKLVPEDLHAPLDQALGVVADSPRQAGARDLAAFITGPQGQEVLHKYGYVIPEEANSR
jgi:molybdate transport system substrate-binding protein